MPDEVWLDKNYTGAPDECSWHFVNAMEIVRKNEDGDCPRWDEHT